MPKKKCLIVEDSPVMRQLLVYALSRIKNLDISEASDGIEGMRSMLNETFDIFIIDINMPIMDGLKLIKHIRTDKLHAKKPIVVVTTEGAEEDRQRASLLGVDAYITKPVQAPNIIDTVNSLLKNG